MSSSTTFGYEKTMWSWFVKNSMQWLQIAKERGGSRPWVLIRGQRSYRPRKSKFETLGDAIAALYDHELDALCKAEKLNPMEFLAYAADTGEV